MSLDSMLSTVRSQLGYHEQSNGTSKYGTWFGQQVHDGSYATGDWCAMGLLWCADRSDNLAALGGVQKKWAWVPSWWTHWKSIDRSGSTRRVGALVFFDFNRTGDPEHVGICTSSAAGNVHTIEFNTSDQCLSRSRSPSDVLGYGYPAYPAPDDDDFWMG